MKISSRFERKYRLDRGDYYRVRNALMPFTVPDYFTLRGKGSYIVRSLYFDTPSYDAYHERDNGDFGRIKLRLRAYTENASALPDISVEMKTKKGRVMEKYSTLVSYERYRHFIRHGSWETSGDQVLVEFERVFRVRNLKPVLLVQYRREAYQARYSSKARITLDHNVRSSRARDLFPSDVLLQPHRPKSIVLEIKSVPESETPWMHRIVRRHSLASTANSKYVQGIEIVRPLMVTPGVVV
jgi:hypothetical protein